MKTITDSFPDIETGNTSKLIYYFDRNMHSLVINGTQTIFETHHKSEMESMIEFLPVYKKGYEQYIDTLNSFDSNNCYEINDELYMTMETTSLSSFKNSTAILYANNENVGMKIVLYTPLLNAYLMNRTGIHGHVHLNIQKKGYGFLLYQKIDEVFNMVSVSSDSPGILIPITESAENLWHKIRREQNIMGIKIYPDFEQDVLNRYNAMVHYFNNRRSMMDIMDKTSYLDNTTIDNFVDYECSIRKDEFISRLIYLQETKVIMKINQDIIMQELAPFNYRKNKKSEQEIDALEYMLKYHIKDTTTDINAIRQKNRLIMEAINAKMPKIIKDSKFYLDAKKNINLSPF